MTSKLSPSGRYIFLGLVLIGVYISAASLLAANKDFTDRGPLSFREPEIKEPLEGAMPIEQARNRCIPDPLAGDTVKVVGAVLEGEPYYACFEIDELGTVIDANVIDARAGLPLKDVRLIKESGAWPWIGVVKTEAELILGGLALAGTLFFFLVYYRRLRPGQPTYQVKWWQRHGFLVTLGVVLPLLGWLVVVALRGISQARKKRVVMQSIVVGGGVFLTFPWFSLVGYPDLWGGVVLGLLTAGYLSGLVGGQRWLRPEGFGVPEDVLLGETPVESYVQSSERQFARPSPRSEAPGPATTKRGRREEESSQFRVQRPNELPNFRSVGGMVELKRELKETFGLT